MKRKRFENLIPKKKRRYSIIINDVLTIVFEFLEPIYLERCRLVCKEWKQIIEGINDYLYKSLFKNHRHFECENLNDTWREKYINRRKKQLSGTWIPFNKYDYNIHKQGVLTHNNGGRPLKFIHRGDSGIKVFCTKTSKIKYHCVSAIGYWLGLNYYKKTVLHKNVGNTILVKKSKTNYVYIKKDIHFFKITDDEIIDYVSPIGNSDVSYPYAFGKKYIYCMNNLRRIRRSTFNKEITFRDCRDFCMTDFSESF
jgi:hypothetical protein